MPVDSRPECRKKDCGKRFTVTSWTKDVEIRNSYCPAHIAEAVRLFLEKASKATKEEWGAAS